MKDAEFDIWLFTKPGSDPYLAACRNGICYSCEILPDGSLLINIDNHCMPPGELKAKITIHADSETMHDGCHDIRLTPKIPVELIDSHCVHHCHSHTPQTPIIVNVSLPMHRPCLGHHVTQKELDNAINGIYGIIGADDTDIEDIIAMFNLD